MPYYMTTVKITPTDNMSERVRAVQYYGKLERDAAEILCRKSRYKDIKFSLNYIPKAVFITKVKYFNSCDFVEII